MSARPPPAARRRSRWSAWRSTPGSRSAMRSRAGWSRTGPPTTGFWSSPRGFWRVRSPWPGLASADGDRMIDSHTHLHLCEPSDSELVEAAATEGGTRMVTVGTDGTSCRSALAAAEWFPQVYAAIGRHPNSATGFDDADLAELEALAAHEKCLAIGETGLDYYRDYAPADDQRRAFEAQIQLARSTGKPLVIHTRAADDDTLAMLDAH